MGSRRELDGETFSQSVGVAGSSEVGRRREGEGTPGHVRLPALWPSEGALAAGGPLRMRGEASSQSAPGDKVLPDGNPKDAWSEAVLAALSEPYQGPLSAPTFLITMSGRHTIRPRTRDALWHTQPGVPEWRRPGLGNSKALTRVTHVC